MQASDREKNGQKIDQLQGQIERKKEKGEGEPASRREN